MLIIIRIPLKVKYCLSWSITINMLSVSLESKTYFKCLEAMRSFEPMIIVIIPMIAVGIDRKIIDKEDMDPIPIVAIDTNFDHLQSFSRELNV